MIFIIKVRLGPHFNVARVISSVACTVMRLSLLYYNVSLIFLLASTKRINNLKGGNNDDNNNDLNIIIKNKLRFLYSAARR